MKAHFLEFKFPQNSDHSLRAFLSLKSAGDMKYDPSAESAARTALFASLGIDLERVVGIELKHTKNVAFIESRDDLLAQMRSNPAGFDGVITRNPLLVPSVTVADCMPIYISCENCQAFGVLHSGWKGTGILKSAIDGMRLRYGCQPADISIILGPSIGSCCYEVDEDRARVFADEFGAESVRVEHVEPSLHKEKDTLYYLDLLAANKVLAAILGINKVAIEHRCTSCDSRFSSFRRDGPARFQRMLAFAVRPFTN